MGAGVPLPAVVMSPAAKPESAMSMTDPAVRAVVAVRAIRAGLPERRAPHLPGLMSPSWLRFFAIRRAGTVCRGSRTFCQELRGCDWADRVNLGAVVHRLMSVSQKRCHPAYGPADIEVGWVA